MADFSIHRKAIQLETTLNHLLQLHDQKDQETEITRIYDSPVRICEEVLDQMATKETLDSIEKIKAKYWPYHHVILTRLREDVYQSLCDDLDMVKEWQS